MPRGITTWTMSDLFISFPAFPCSENFSYQPCIAACEVPESCENKEVAPLGSDSCSVLTEGCVCAGGTLLHRTHTAVCIPEEKCGIFGCDFLLYYLCKVVVRHFIIHKLSSGGLVLCEFWICPSFENSRYPVNINCVGEEAGDVLVMHNFAHFLSAGGCSSKSLLEFMYSVIVSMLVLASFSPKPFAKGPTFWYPFKWHAAAVNYTFWVITCVLLIFIAILPHHTK